MLGGGTDKIVRFFQNFHLQRFGDYFACQRGMSKDLENAIGPRLAVLEESPMSIPCYKNYNGKGPCEVLGHLVIKSLLKFDISTYPVCILTPLVNHQGTTPTGNAF